ncbi:hypothetical protein J6590_044060 [Homalodisca vitripennis]|nr:hypothetical protein J6590_044060 [Homalodisca vitripennis]
MGWYLKGVESRSQWYTLLVTRWYRTSKDTPRLASSTAVCVQSQPSHSLLQNPLMMALSVSPRDGYDGHPRLLWLYASSGCHADMEVNFHESIYRTTCTAERSFSTNKRVKNFLGNEMRPYSLSTTGKYQLSGPHPPNFSGYVLDGHTPRDLAIPNFNKVSSGGQRGDDSLCVVGRRADIGGGPDRKPVYAHIHTSTYRLRSVIHYSIIRHGHEIPSEASQIQITDMTVGFCISTVNLVWTDSFACHSHRLQWSMRQLFTLQPTLRCRCADWYGNALHKKWANGGKNETRHAAHLIIRLPIQMRYGATSTNDISIRNPRSTTFIHGDLLEEVGVYRRVWNVPVYKSCLSKDFRIQFVWGAVGQAVGNKVYYWCPEFCEHALYIMENSL